jgi:hypothetical protein
MDAIDGFVARSQERLGALARGVSSSLGWNAAERKALADLAAEIVPRGADDLRARPLRVYLEIGAGARKPLLMAAALWPELGALGRQSGLAPALFVTEPEVRRSYEAFLHGPETPIHGFAESADLLGALGGHHNTIFFVADIDTEQAGPLTASRQWTPVARAIDKLITNKLANFVMIHQLGKHALDPTAG